MSPVPPATSRIFQPCGVEASRGEVRGLVPGFRLRTKWSFQRRWMPRDMRSFMASYELATEEKTLRTGKGFLVRHCRLGPCSIAYPWPPLTTRRWSRSRSGWSSHCFLAAGRDVRRTKSSGRARERVWRAARAAIGGGKRGRRDASWLGWKLSTRWDDFLEVRNDFLRRGCGLCVGLRMRLIAGYGLHHRPKVAVLLHTSALPPQSLLPLDCLPCLYASMSLRHSLPRGLSSKCARISQTSPKSHLQPWPQQRHPAAPRVRWSSVSQRPGSDR